MSATRDAIKKGSKKRAHIGELRIKTKHCLEESSEKLKELTKERDEAERQLKQNQRELRYLQLQEQLQGNNDDLKSIIAIKMTEIEELRRAILKFEDELSQARDTQLTSSNHVEDLSEERERVHRELKNKNIELHALRFQEQNNAELRAIIEHKEAEIVQMRIHVADVESKLNQAKDEREKFQEQLQQMSQDLAKQSARLRELEKTQAGLERERSRVDARLKTESDRIEVCSSRKKPICVQYIILSQLAIMHTVIVS